MPLCVFMLISHEKKSLRVINFFKITKSSMEEIRSKPMFETKDEAQQWCSSTMTLRAYFFHECAQISSAELYCQTWVRFLEMQIRYLTKPLLDIRLMEKYLMI